MGRLAKDVTRAEGVKTKPRQRNGRVEYRTIEFNDTHKEWIQSMIVNGKSRAEIAESLGLSESGLRISLANREDIQHILKNGALKTVKEATTSLHKLALGYVRYEKKYLVGLNDEKLEASSDLMVKMIQDKDWDSFRALLPTLTLTGQENASGVVEVKEIEVPPDRNAAVKELEVLNGLIWDLETNRKKIPAVKIVVGLEGGTRQSRKEVKPDYVVGN